MSLVNFRAVGKEAIGTTNQVASQPVPSPVVSANCNEANTKSNGRGKKNKSKNKSRSVSASQPVAVPLAAAKPTPVLWTPPAPKRSTTPSPTMSSSSQRSQTPPPSSNLPPPISLPVPTLKVVTTKEETRLFKPKPNNKKVKSKSTAPEETKHVAPAKAASTSAPLVTPTNPPSTLVTPSAKQSTTNSGEKRGRSSSVPSNNRNKTASATVQKSKNAAASPPSSKVATTTTTTSPTVVAVAAVTATKSAQQEVPKKTTESDVTLPAATPTTVWQPRAHNKSLVKTPATPLLQQTSNRPQPPVGKILPEIRRAPEEQTALPKPIGYRNHVGEKTSPPPSAWNTETSTSWYNLSPSTTSPSAPSGAWWPDGGSSLSRNVVGPPEVSRDCFGLSHLASDFTESANNVVGNPMWPVNSSYPSELTPSTEMWPDAQANPSLQTVSSNTTPVSRVYSPWSVPNWLDVTQSRQQQPQRRSQDPILLHNPNVTTPNHQSSMLDQGLMQNNSLWNAPRNQPGNESWPSYSQF